MNDAVFSYTLLNDLAVVTLTGKDATQFLQSQLTQDLADLDYARAVLAGYCTARGRLLASMVALQQTVDAANTDAEDGWLLITKADGALAFAQRLRMFVLRAKVDVQISEMTVLGARVAPVNGPDSASTAKPQLAAGAAALTVVRQDDQTWIAAPRRDDSSDARWWVLGAAPIQDADRSPSALSSWQADDIAVGFPWVQAATQDTFIPQTLNMDLIDGVSFTKGCYPGQEVVARSHYRGTVKRRMAYGTVDAALADVAGPAKDLPSTDVFDAKRPRNPCGRVVNASANDSGLHLLLEIQLADLDEADFRLGSEDGPAITIRPLPYSIRPDPSK